MYHTKIDQFHGPLDLLLSLIKEEKLDISQVALAQVTDQYLAYLEEAKDIAAVELADFLVVATKLLVIKSRALLPQLADDEEDSAEELEAQLKIYQDYLAAVKQVEALIARKNFAFSREKIAFNFAPAFSPPSHLTGEDLRAVFQEVLGRIDYVVNLPQKIMARAISLKEIIANIRNIFQKSREVNFKDIMAGAKSRGEMVVCFMALLELIKSGEVAVTQKGIFDDILVEKASH